MLATTRFNWIAPVLWLSLVAGGCGMTRKAEVEWGPILSIIPDRWNCVIPTNPNEFESPLSDEVPDPRTATSLNFQRWVNRHYEWAFPDFEFSINTVIWNPEKIDGENVALGLCCGRRAQFGTWKPRIQVAKIKVDYWSEGIPRDTILLKKVVSVAGKKAISRAALEGALDKLSDRLESKGLVLSWAVQRLRQHDDVDVVQVRFSVEERRRGDGDW